MNPNGDNLTPPNQEPQPMGVPPLQEQTPAAPIVEQTQPQSVPVVQPAAAQMPTPEVQQPTVAASVVDPTQPQPTQFFGAAPADPAAPVPAPAKSNKKLFIILGSVFGGLILLGGLLIGILFAVGAFTVTHEDYVELQDVMDTAYDSETDSAWSNFDYDTATVDDLRSAYSESTDLLDEGMSKIGSTKAVRLDSELNSAFANIEDQNDAYKKYFEMSLDSSIVTLLMTQATSDLPDDATSAERAEANVKALDEAASEVTTDGGKQYVEDLKGAYQDQLEAARAYEDIRDDYISGAVSYDEYSKLSDAYLGSYSKISDIRTAYSDSIADDTGFDYESYGKLITAFEDLVDKKVDESK